VRPWAASATPATPGKPDLKTEIPFSIEYCLAWYYSLNFGASDQFSGSAEAVAGLPAPVKAINPA
jgi:hypothetical protein